MYLTTSYCQNIALYNTLLQSNQMKHKCNRQIIKQKKCQKRKKEKCQKMTIKNNSESQSLLNQLPQEILIQIFDYCTEKDLMIMRQVSRKFLHIINDNSTRLLQPTLDHLLLYNDNAISNMTTFLNSQKPSTSTLSFDNESDILPICVFARRNHFSSKQTYNIKKKKSFHSTRINGSGSDFLSTLLRQYRLNGKLEFERILFKTNFLSQFHHNKTNLR